MGGAVRRRTNANLSVQEAQRLRKEIASKQERLPLTREEVTLTSGQTTVVFATVSTTALFYVFGNDIGGGRLPPSAYTITNETTIELNESYPDGTIIFGEMNA